MPAIQALKYHIDNEGRLAMDLRFVI